MYVSQLNGHALGSAWNRLIVVASAAEFYWTVLTLEYPPVRTGVAEAAVLLYQITW